MTEATDTTTADTTPHPTEIDATDANRSIAHRVGDVVRDLDRAVIGWAVVLFVVFLVVEPIVFRSSRLPISYYEGGSIALGTLRSPIVVAGWLIALVIVAIRPGLAWHRLDRSFRLLRIPTLTAVVALTWHLSTLEFNFAIGETFVVDRIVLVALAVGCCFHPGVLAAFVVFAHAVTGQLNVAPMFFSWTDTMVLHQILLVVVVATVAMVATPILTDLVRRRRDGRAISIPAVPAASVWAVFVGIFGSWYLRSALGKARLGWVQTNDLSNIVRAARQQHGWLGWVDEATFESIATFVGDFVIPVQIGAIIAEFAVLAYFWSRRVSCVVATLGIALHAMVFATTGILFWKWMAVDAALIAAFLLAGRGDATAWKETFPRGTMLLATATVMLAHGAVSPRVTELAWYDSTFVYRFQFRATGESGEVYEVLPEQFAPWDSRFGQSRWFFLTDVPLLVDVFGSIKNERLLDELAVARTPDEVEKLIDEFGSVRADPGQRAAFVEFLRSFIDSTRQGEPASLSGLSLVRAPHHLWTRQPPDVDVPVYDFGEPLVGMEVGLTMWNLVDGEYLEVAEIDDVLDEPFDIDD